MLPLSWIFLCLTQPCTNFQDLHLEKLMVFFSRFHILKLSSSQFFKSIKNQYRGINYVQMYR